LLYTKIPGCRVALPIADIKAVIDIDCSNVRLLYCCAPQGSRISIVNAIGNVAATSVVYWAYEAPTLASVTPPVVSPLGRVQVIITGSNFGLPLPSSTVAIGGRPCRVVVSLQFCPLSALELVPSHNFVGCTTPLPSLLPPSLPHLYTHIGTLWLSITAVPQ
jgi:hypothetical protein